MHYFSRSRWTVKRDFVLTMVNLRCTEKSAQLHKTATLGLEYILF